MTFQTFHSLTSALNHTMAKQELLALNWPTSLHLEYGQQWGQSDGVVFHGTLSSADLLRIIPGLRGKRYLSRCNARALFTAVREQGIRVQLELTQSWYSLSWDTRLADEGFSDEMEMLEKRLLQALREQYECLCHSVNMLGYKLTEGTYPAEYDENLFTRATANITLEAVAVDPCDCGYCDTDEAILEEYIRMILDDNARVVSVRFQVKCAGQLMAESWASEVVILPGQPVRKWVCRSEIQYVANEARHATTDQVQAFRSFVHAA
ncbi:hypothetical protein KGP26_29310 (plasmid) [Serratia sp. JSRIV002]|uniref:hypothetical protein n=1 Tax=Serratia sp. JSRIV002 TaxID=2831894 RepID=UPI001CC13C00|nr:hypothetical protein [Serratia sp. JSRIV002]UAN54663.1 hypothetical protein KGP26_29310 [Serratia sp. JSRIV002]